MALPNPKRRGRPPGSKNQTTTSKLVQAVTEGTSEPLVKTARDLPTDPSEFEKAIAPYRIYVKPPVQALSALAEAVDTSPFNAEEKEAGINAGAMLCYQYQANLNAWFAVGMFALGVGAPRFVEFMDKRKEKQKQLNTTGNLAVVPQATKPLPGDVG